MIARPTINHFASFLVLCVISFTAVNANGDSSELSKRQQGVANRFERLEELLLRLAEMEATENPERAALLRRAAKQSSKKFVLSQLRAASESLGNQEFQKAVDQQDGAKTELAALLKLLMSEDRSKRIRKEKDRFKNLIKDLKRNLNNQRSTRARTENDAKMKEVKQEQKSVTDRSKELRDRLNADNKPIEIQEDSKRDPKKAKPKDPPSAKPPSKDPKSKNPKPTDSQPAAPEEAQPDRSDTKHPDGSPPKGSPSKSDSPPKGGQKPGKKQSGKKQPSKKQQGQSPSPPQTPEQEVEQQLQQAIEKMQQAEEELDKAKRGDATEKQREAEEHLRAAIDRLERILRQLREEEMQRELAKLEARLRKMSSMQTEVLKKTVALAATPKSQRDRSTDLTAGGLSFEEKKITLEADRAMLLLREEGSSVAFPEVVSGIRVDTARVAARLGKAQVDTITQGIQRDILASLEEMIAALQKAQQDLEKQKKQQQSGKPGQSGQGEQPLVQAIAELKLLRTMETRIKSTTGRYSGLLESGESSHGDVLPLLLDLADRQSRLYQIARDLVLKRNQ